MRGTGGLRGHKGNMLFIKVIKSRKWKNNARNIILFRCSKALYFHTFSKMFLSKCTLKNIYNTPQIFSGMLKIAPKALHFPPPPSLPSLWCQPRWLSGLRRSRVHSLVIARRSLCPEQLGSNPGQGSKGINFSGWHGFHMSVTVTKRR